MLRVRTDLRYSSINGIGLFALEPIKIDTVTWIFDEGIDHEIDADAIPKLPKEAQDFLFRYGFFSADGKTLFHCADDLRFINHSRAPNIGSTPFRDRALRDIKAGEELTCDYSAYEANWFARRGVDPESFA